MKRNQTSTTALGIAVLRAYESAKPAGECICDDPLARRFAGRLFYQLLRLFLAPVYAIARATVKPAGG